MKALKETILFSIFFLILVATYTSFSFIVTYMYQHKQEGFKQMGPVLLAANYIVFLIANSFAPSIRLTHKTQLKLAAMCYTFNYITQALMLPGGWGIAFSIFGTMVGGFGAAILWVSYGSYMKTLCKMNNQQHIQGRYFAISNGISFASILLGPIITTFCFQLFSDQVYFIVLSGFGLFAIIYCSIFVKQIQNPSEFQSYHCWYQLKKSLKFYKKMTAVIPALIFDGLVLGFVSTSSTNLMPKDSERVEIGIFLIILGLGCIIGGFLAGYLTDFISSKNTGKLSVMIVLVVSFITVLLNPYMSKPFAFFCAILWGLARQFIQGWLYVACAINYNCRLESYANMKQLHSLAFCIYEAVAIVTHLKLQTSYFMLIFIVLSPISFYFLNSLPEPIIDKTQQKQKQDKSISLQSSSQQSN